MYRVQQFVANNAYKTRLNAIQQAAEPKSAIGTSPNAEQRWARRAPCNTPASLWHGSLPGAIKCYVRDQSSSGALVETSSGDANLLDLLVSVDKPFSLTIQTSKERTEVSCTIAWRAGRRLGVRYVSPFKTIAQVNRPVRKITARR